MKKTGLGLATAPFAATTFVVTFGDAALLDVGVEALDWGIDELSSNLFSETGFWILINPNPDSPIWVFMIYNS